MVSFGGGVAVNLITRVTSTNFSRSRNIIISSRIIFISFVRAATRSGASWSIAIGALSRLHIVESLLEPRLDGFDLSDGLVKEGINLSLHLDIEFIVVFFEFDGFHSLVHFSDQNAELFFGRLVLIMIRINRRRWLFGRVLAPFRISRAWRRLDGRSFSLGAENV